MQQVEGTVAYKRFDYGAHPIQIKVTYQGCAEAGLCYPPITKVLFPQSPAAQPCKPLAQLGRHRDHWRRMRLSFAGLLLRKGRRLDLPAP